MLAFAPVIKTLLEGTLLHCRWECKLVQLLPRWLRGKESACQCRRCKRHEFNPWVWKIPWRGKRQPTPVLLPENIHRQRSLAGYSPWGLKELDTVEHALTHSMENSMELPPKTKSRVTRWFWNHTTGHILRENHTLKWYVYPDIHCSTIDNSQHIETT